MIKAHFLLLTTLLLGAASSALAAPLRIQIDQPLAHGIFKIGVGSAITLTLPDQRAPHHGVFLGVMRHQDRSMDSYILLDSETQHVYFADAKSVVVEEGPHLETILKPYAQLGETCTGYAIDHYLVQMHFSGFEGNGEIGRTLASEKGRTELLVDAINQYYLVLQHRYSISGILNGYGKKFGFQCQYRKFDTAEKARAHLQERLHAGIPVLVSFFVGPKMVRAKFEMTYWDRPSQKLEPELWVPRKIGERESGGHSVVAVGAFETNGRQELLMLDSDWDEPRIWDAQDYLNDRTDMKQLELISCG